MFYYYIVLHYTNTTELISEIADLFTVIRRHLYACMVLGLSPMTVFWPVTTISPASR